MTLRGFVESHRVRNLCKFLVSRSSVTIPARCSYFIIQRGYMTSTETQPSQRIIRSRSGPIGFVRSLARLLSGKPTVPPSLADNPLLETILQRRSVRTFDKREIPDDVFAAILEAARVAPSTVNLQSWSFAVFTAETWRATFEHPIPFQGQRAVIVMGDTHRDRIVLDAFPQSPLIEYTLGVVNASLAAMNMNIAAEALGVSSVMLSETGRTGLLDAGYLKQISVPARWCLPAHDHHLRLSARAVSADAAQTAARSNLLHGPIPRTRSRHHGRLARADESGLQSQPSAVVL